MRQRIGLVTTTLLLTIAACDGESTTDPGATSQADTTSPASAADSVASPDDAEQPAADSATGSGDGTETADTATDDATEANGGDTITTDVACTTENAAFKCDDSDPCTEDTCKDTTCAHTPIAGCCMTDADCDDGVDCTVDECLPVPHKCSHSFEDSQCCLTPADCDDADPCTQDACAANRCVHPRTAASGCTCETSVDCEDGNPCTADACWDGACAYALTGGGDCCTTTTDCDDNDAATYNACQQGQCWITPAACEQNEDCTPTDPCLTATCEEGECTFTKEPSCCTTDVDCFDGTAETVDICVESRCVNMLVETAPCTADDDCDAPNPCVQVDCVEQAALCSATPTPSAPGCCTTSADCQAPQCEVATCESFQCQTSPGPAEVAWETTWDDGTLQGWQIADDGSGATWIVQDKNSISPNHALYYGRLPENDYDVGLTQGVATSPAIDLSDPPVPVTLSFWIAPNVEVLFSVDQVKVELQTPTETVELWTKSDLIGVPIPGWKQIKKDITEHTTAPFQIAIHFNSIDATHNDHEGVYVDDVQILVPCE